MVLALEAQRGCLGLYRERSIQRYDHEKTTWLGHVEYATDNVVTSGQSAVSGIVTLKGKASDNERISKITDSDRTTVSMVRRGRVTDPIHDLYLGQWFPVLQRRLRPDGHVVYRDWGNSRNRQLGRLGRWDRLQVDRLEPRGPGSRRELELRLGQLQTQLRRGDRGEDGLYSLRCDNTPQTNSDSITVDVAPYITKVTTNLSSINASNPSVFNSTALGHYPIAENDLVTLAGFNLYYSASTTAKMNGTRRFYAEQPVDDLDTIDRADFDGNLRAIRFHGQRRQLGQQHQTARMLEPGTNSPTTSTTTC